MPPPSLQLSTPGPQASSQQSTTTVYIPLPHLLQQSNTTVLLQSPQLQPPRKLTNSTQMLQPVDAGTQYVAQLPFFTPPKLLLIERVVMDYPGMDETSLRWLTTALACEAIFSRDALCCSSKNNMGSLEKHKLD